MGLAVPISVDLGVSISISMLGLSMGMLDASIASPKPFGLSECCHAASTGIITSVSMLGSSPCPFNMSMWILVPSISSTACFTTLMPRSVQRAWGICQASWTICLVLQHFRLATQPIHLDSEPICLINAHMHTRIPLTAQIYCPLPLERQSVCERHVWKGFRVAAQRWHIRSAILIWPH
ncbi:hypothetical protein SCLCIDRAFT_25958 [Scleroderma citrinum Foug A]|uniref:Uncharacterized protein n=1 Tax=Scleroderma citrinum Foug A TaxID=1036808 RepID=A0A0C3A8X7_9AGAM|nr:hypothetical protein SCLCIDRAFT_25958 [Scleroderma citrinum Foug A]